MFASSVQSKKVETTNMEKIKDKFVKKAQELNKTIEGHPVSSSVIASSLAFLGLYKAVISPELENNRETIEGQRCSLEGNRIAIRNLNQNIQGLNRQLENCRAAISGDSAEARESVEGLRTSLSYASNGVARLSQDFSQRIDLLESSTNDEFQNLQHVIDSLQHSS